MTADKLRVEIRKHLKARKLSHEAFARNCDVSLSWLSKFLRSDRMNPRMDTVEKLQRGMQ